MHRPDNRPAFDARGADDVTLGGLLKHRAAVEAVGGTLGEAVPAGPAKGTTAQVALVAMVEGA